MIKKIVERFYIKEEENSIREDSLLDNLLGELEIDSDQDSENEAQIDIGEIEFSNNSEFFEP